MDPQPRSSYHKSVKRRILELSIPTILLLQTFYIATTTTISSSTTLKLWQRCIPKLAIDVSGSNWVLYINISSASWAFRR